MDDLSHRIRTQLPQELQDTIFEFLIEIRPNQIVRIDRTLKAPWQLRINKKMRQELAPIYFGSTILMSFDRLYPHGPTDTTKKWFQAQTQPHREMITKARIYAEENIPDYMTHYQHDYRQVLLHAKPFLSHRHVRENVVIEMNVRYHDPDDGQFKQAWARLEKLDGLFRCQCTAWKMCLLAY